MTLGCIAKRVTITGLLILLGMSGCRSQSPVRPPEIINLAIAPSTQVYYGEQCLDQYQTSLTATANVILYAPIKSIMLKYRFLTTDLSRTSQWYSVQEDMEYISGTLYEINFEIDDVAAQRFLDGDSGKIDFQVQVIDQYQSVAGMGGGLRTLHPCPHN